MLTLTFNGKVVMKMTSAHLPFHTPEKRGQKSWSIKDENGNVVDSYKPPKPPARAKPITKYQGSWAQQEAARRGR